MEGADGHRQGIRGVIRTRQLRHAQEHLDHAPDLLLARPAIARHGDLDLVRPVLEDGQAMLGRREESHAPGLADREGRLDVAVEVEPLDAHGVRSMGLDEVDEGLVDEQQPGAQDTAKIERIYDVSFNAVAKAVAAEGEYCSEAKTATIKADLGRHLAGDYTPRVVPKEDEEGLFSGWGSGSDGPGMKMKHPMDNSDL